MKNEIRMGQKLQNSQWSWRIFSHTSSKESFFFFLLGLNYTLKTCFESKTFLPKSCPELSNQVLSFQKLKKTPQPVLPYFTLYTFNFAFSQFSILAYLSGRLCSLSRDQNFLWRHFHKIVNLSWSQSHFEVALQTYHQSFLRQRQFFS